MQVNQGIPTLQLPPLTRAGLYKSLDVKPLHRCTFAKEKEGLPVLLAVIDRPSLDANSSGSLENRNTHWETPKVAGVPNVEAPVSDGSALCSLVSVPS